MIIDVHAHHTPPTLARALAGRPRQAGRAATRFSNPAPAFEARFGLMAEAGVGRQILSIASGFYGPDETTGVECARGVNDDLSQLCRERPQQLSFWASVPLPHIDAALRETARAMALPGCVGVLINCFILGRSIADGAFEPLYAELNRRGAIVFLHPSQNGLLSPLINDWDLTVCAGASMEDAVAALVPGSDYPILLPWESYAQTFQHIREAELPPAIVEQILEHNAPQLLGL